MPQLPASLQGHEDPSSRRKRELMAKAASAARQMGLSPKVLSQPPPEPEPPPQPRPKNALEKLAQHLPGAVLLAGDDEGPATLAELIDAYIDEAAPYETQHGDVSEWEAMEYGERMALVESNHDIAILAEDLHQEIQAWCVTQGTMQKSLSLGRRRALARGLLTVAATLAPPPKVLAEIKERELHRLGHTHRSPIRLPPSAVRVMIQTAAKICQNKATAATEELAASLALLTGRRTGEILMCGDLAELPQGVRWDCSDITSRGKHACALFSGQLKQRDEPMPPYPIPLPVLPALVVSAWEELRTRREIAVLSQETDLTKLTHHKHYKEFLNACHRLYGAGPHHLRHIYAAYGYHYHTPPGTKEVFTALVLGHGDRRKPDLATALAYSHVEVRPVMRP